jgi:hypothetical protein
MQPETLGRYRIVKELGRGAMGCVYLAHDPRIDRQVAIKTIQIFSGLPDAERREARERFLREARVAGRLSHPCIVTVHDVGEQDGVPYLAMELVEGTTLDKFCQPESLLSVDTVVEMICAVAEALEYAHSTGVVHRDIKPANLMRVEDVTVKIMDFGLARGVEAQASQERALYGTPSYMSPEQIRGEELDGRSDLFSLAAVLYQLLTGEKAFGGDTVSSIIYRVVHEAPRDAQASSRVDPALARFLERALSKERDARFPTGGAFAASLRHAAATMVAQAPAAVAAAGPAGNEAPDAPASGVPAPPGDVSDGSIPEASLPAARRRRRNSRSSFPWVALLLVVVLGAGGAAAWVYREPLMAFVKPAPREVWLETRVRTDPPGLPVTLDGEPLQSETVRYLAKEPFAVLAVSEGCRVTEHTLSAADGGAEVVLVPDPTEVELLVDPAVDGARVRVNGEASATAPVSVALDLCRENTIAIEAEGHHDETVVLAAGATPLEARTALTGMRLRPIPKGLLELAKAAVSLRYYVDGEEVKRGDSPIELYEGRHKLRLVNAKLWIDVTQTVEVRGGETVRPALSLPGVGTMVVQAFPANCKVYLRRRGGRWRYLDDTPMRRELAAGRYELKVELKRTGDVRVRDVLHEPGDNPPIRISFGSGA